MAKKFRDTENLNYDRLVHNLRNRYYNLYRANFRAKKLNYRQEDYVMNKFWNDGTVSAFEIKLVNELGFAPWAMQTWDMYGCPEKVNLINEKGSPLIPSTTQIVDKDVVIGYIQPNHKPLKMLVDWYIERIAQVEMVINTNLQIHKMPFVIPVDDEKEKAKIKDAIDRILNNELVLFIDGVNPQLFKAISTAAPYIIDKLQNYKKDLENDLKTILGVNNNGTNKIEQLQMAEVNSNNAEINSFDNLYEDELKKFDKRLMETFGKDCGFECVAEKAVLAGQAHDMTEQPGPKGEEYED